MNHPRFGHNQLQAKFVLTIFILLMRLQYCWCALCGLTPRRILLYLNTKGKFVPSQ